MGVKISALPSGAALSSTDAFAVVQSGTTNKVLWSAILTALAAAQEGQVISSSNYTAVPSTTSVILFSDTTGIVVGDPIVLTQDSVLKYFVVTAVSTNTSITVSGPPLTGASAITNLAVLQASTLVQLDVFCPGGYDFDNDTTALILRATKSPLRWQMPNARLVRASFAHNTVGTGAQPKVNVSIGGTAVFTDNSNAGATMSGTVNTWVSIGEGTAALANYSVSFGSAIELILDAGANLNARDLTVSLIFVLV